MGFQIVAFYFFADEVLKASHLLDDPQVKMTNAEVIKGDFDNSMLFS